MIVKSFIDAKRVIASKLRKDRCDRNVKSSKKKDKKVEN